MQELAEDVHSLVGRAQQVCQVGRNETGHGLVRFVNNIKGSVRSYHRRKEGHQDEEGDQDQAGRSETIFENDAYALKRPVQKRPFPGGSKIA